MSVTLRVNGAEHTLDVDPEMPLLWVLRDVLGLTGTKYGCGEALCGNCTVHLAGMVVRSCVTPVGRAEGRDVTTIEGLSPDGSHPLQRAWVELGVPQCGFCQAGQIMTAAALLTTNPDPSDDDIDRTMAGNLCRCGTYGRIRAAIHRAAAAGGAAAAGAGATGAAHGPGAGGPAEGAPGDAAGSAPEGAAPQGGAPQGGAPDGGAPQGGAPDGGAPAGGPAGGATPGGSAPTGGGPDGGPGRRP